MSRLAQVLPKVSTEQLRSMFAFFEGPTIRHHYAGLRADIRAELGARGVTDSELDITPSRVGGPTLVR